MQSKNYIAYLDLLGIKDVAKYDDKGYFMAMTTFRNSLIKTALIFDEEKYSSNSNIYFFSDCAFVESDSFETIADYFIFLRRTLTKEKLFFSAAITVGNLQAHNVCRNMDSSNYSTIECDTIEKTKNYVNGVLFELSDVSEVYVLQNSLKGIGIFLSKKIFLKLKVDIRLELRNSYSEITEEELAKKVDEKYNQIYNDYISESFYFPSINTTNAQNYFDIKLSKYEISESFFNIIKEKYHSSNIKNKKYGRFYLSHFANWISSENFKVINEDYEGDDDDDIDSDLLKFEHSPLIFKKFILEKDYLITDLIKNAHCFEFLLFFILNSLYDIFPNYNKTIYTTIELINKTPSSKKYITKIESLPKGVLSEINKDRFIHDYHKVIQNLSSLKEKAIEDRRLRKIKALKKINND